MSETTTYLTGLTHDELRAYAESVGQQSYRGSQIFGWIHARGAAAFADMTDVSQAFRSLLEQRASIRTLRLRADERSADGTQKFAFELPDGGIVESVLIPADQPDDRLTLCVSTQVGCPLDCAFCATGTMGFGRNLSAGEILEQFLVARDAAGRRISNVVYMGMGEPMLNYDAVMTSTDILLDERGAGIGARHITVSTAGYADRIRRMADEQRRIRLALSLHTLDERKRTQLMPITKKFGIAALTDALSYYVQKTRQRPTMEYILFEGFNDALADADALIRLGRRLPLKVNLIPFHSIDFTRPSGLAASLRPASPERIAWFAQKLRDGDITTMVRKSSGVDIQAACGQLAAAESGRTVLRTAPGG